MFHLIHYSCAGHITHNLCKTLLLQVHYEYWRRILKYFWMSVVMYTMLVLTLVYTFQFKGSVNFWSKMLGMDELRSMFELYHN